MCSVVFQGEDRVSGVETFRCHHTPPQGARVVMLSYDECQSPVLLDLHGSPGNHSFEVPPPSYPLLPPSS